MHGLLLSILNVICVSITQAVQPAFIFNHPITPASTNKFCHLSVSLILNKQPLGHTPIASTLKKKEKKSKKIGSFISVLCFLSFKKLLVHVETCSLISQQLSFSKSLCWGITLIAFGNQRMSYQPLCTGSLLPSKNFPRFVGSDAKESTSSTLYTIFFPVCCCRPGPNYDTVVNGNYKPFFREKKKSLKFWSL